jgi:hypothetical protein
LPLDAGVVAVPPLVSQRRVGPCSHGPALRRARRWRSRRTALSMVVIGTHRARAASNGGFTFHDRGGPYGRRKAKRVIAVDVWASGGRELWSTAASAAVVKHLGLGQESVRRWVLDTEIDSGARPRYDQCQTCRDQGLEGQSAPTGGG